jgi:hypothetical protein
MEEKYKWVKSGTNNGLTFVIFEILEETIESSILEGLKPKEGVSYSSNGLEENIVIRSSRGWR